MDCDKIEAHIVKLYTIGSYMISRNFIKLIQYIEDEYFSKQVFDSKSYVVADDFVFRMDITSLTYSNAFELSYRELKEGNFAQYLLGLKSIIVKLKGNQRYTYYDRECIRETLKCIEEEYSLTGQYGDYKDILEILDVNTLKDGLVGFEELNFEEYYKNSTKSIYSKNKSMDEKFYELELKTAAKKGIIYHYIVEIDHYINKNINSTNFTDWVFLAKLLSLYYTTEKKPWTSDMTKDMIRAYYGIKCSCDPQKFEEVIFQLTTENLKLIIKKSSMYNDLNVAEEIYKAINYLINVFKIHKDERYINYIKNFLVVLERLGQQDKVEEVRAGMYAALDIL